MTPLDILLVSQSYRPVYGGISEHVHHLALALRDRGHRVRILTSGPGPAGEDCGIQLLRIGRRFRFPSNGAMASLSFHARYRAAVRRALATPTDLIHIHSPLEPFLPWAVLHEARVPCIGTFHNAGGPHWGYRVFSRWLAPLAERLTLRAAVSESAARYAGRHFPGEYLLIPNGVDRTRFHPNGSRPPGRKPTFLFVGRLEPRKGLDLLLDGIDRAARSLPERPLLRIVGDGRCGRLLRRSRRDRAFDLDWRGDVPPEDLPQIYREADLFVSPALHGESFGVVLLEALASGIPVVASAIEGYRDLLRDCPSAVLVAPGSATDLARGIVQAWRELPGDAARRGGVEHTQPYDWQHVALITEVAYREALGRPPLPGSPGIRRFCPVLARGSKGNS